MRSTTPYYVCPSPIPPETGSARRQAPLHGERAAGVGAAGDDAEVAARGREQLVVDMRLRGGRHRLRAWGRERASRAGMRQAPSRALPALADVSALGARAQPNSS